MEIYHAGGHFASEIVVQSRSLRLVSNLNNSDGIQSAKVLFFLILLVTARVLRAQGI